MISINRRLPVDQGRGVKWPELRGVGVGTFSFVPPGHHILASPGYGAQEARKRK